MEGEMGAEMLSFGEGAPTRSCTMEWELRRKEEVGRLGRWRGVESERRRMLSTMHMVRHFLSATATTCWFFYSSIDKGGIVEN
jgi:hypothetical protein